ncbi:hypothetical protein B296_00046663, partial [Ensete ventricosum]
MDGCDPTRSDRVVEANSSSQQGLARALHSAATGAPDPEASAPLGRFRLNNLGPQPGSKKKNKRKGRGIAAGQGNSCGFGMRGQKSRSGPGVRKGFEGGQMPLYRRIPKLRGIAGGLQFRLVRAVHIGPPGYRYADRAVPPKIDHRRSIEREIDRWRSIEEEKRKKKRKRRKKEEEKKEYLARVLSSLAGRLPRQLFLMREETERLPVRGERSRRRLRKKKGRRRGKEEKMKRTRKNTSLARHLLPQPLFLLRKETERLPARGERSRRRRSFF